MIFFSRLFLGFIIAHILALPPVLAELTVDFPGQVTSTTLPEATDYCQLRKDTKTPSLTNLTNETIPLKVLSLSFIPDDNHDGYEDKLEIGLDGEALSIEHRELEINQLEKNLCGYREKTSVSMFSRSKIPYIDYQIITKKTFPTSVPKTWYFPYTKPKVDHHLLLGKQLNICDWVDNKDVREVWIWMYHTPYIEPIESNMAMGTLSKKHYNNITFGDISNTGTFKVADLPVCVHTYVVYEFNYLMSVAEALHNFAHQVEEIFTWADVKLFNSFVGQKFLMPQKSGCGTVHYPPNATRSYDYENRAYSSSICSNWTKKDPVKELVNCETWQCSHLGYMQWWLQHLPGHNMDLADSLYDTVPNIHAFFVDFDLAVDLFEKAR